MQGAASSVMWRVVGFKGTSVDEKDISCQYMNNVCAENTPVWPVERENDTLVGHDHDEHWHEFHG